MRFSLTFNSLDSQGKRLSYAGDKVDQYTSKNEVIKEAISTVEAGIYEEACVFVLDENSNQFLYLIGFTKES